MCDRPVPHHISENAKGHNGWCDMKEGEGEESMLLTVTVTYMTL